MPSLEMPTLNKAKAETRTALKIIGLILAVTMIIYTAVKGVSFIISLFTPPPAPTVAFGKLPAIPFPEQNNENITYSIDTVTGYLPTLPDQVKVYEIISNSPNLIGLTKTAEKVKKVGFSSPERKISEDTYQWTEEGPLQRTITMNIFSSDFILYSSYLTVDSLQSFLSVDEKENITRTSKNFLSKMSLWPEDIDEEKTKISFYSITDNQLDETSKVSGSKIAKIDFFQKNVNDLPIYYQKGTSSTISFLVGKPNKKMEVVEGSFLYKKISDTSSTYAIKTAEEAFQELQEDKGYISYESTNKTNINIKDVYLGYYIGEAQQKYLMPIIVFEGIDFTAYVSAVKDEWISN